MLGFFSPNPSVKIILDDNEQMQSYRDNVLKSNLPIFTKGDTIRGTLQIVPPPGKTVVHSGILLFIIGESRKPDGTVIERFFARKQELVPSGELKCSINTEFVFDNITFPISSYKGVIVNAIYAIQLVVVHRIVDYKVEQQFLYIDFKPRPKKLIPIHNEIGIRNVLHIEFVFPSKEIDSREPLIGAVYFITVKLRIVHMSLILYCEESYMNQGVFFTERTQLQEMEIMDGPPCRGDYIPIRFFVSNNDIWPYEGNEKVSLKVQYYFKAIFIDENGKRYNKNLKVEFKRFRPKEMTKQWCWIIFIFIKVKLMLVLSYADSFI